MGSPREYGQWVVLNTPTRLITELYISGGNIHYNYGGYNNTLTICRASKPTDNATVLEGVENCGR